jgi:hypothetical protein
MKGIKNREIAVSDHTTDGFTLYYRDERNRVYSKRYVGYGVDVAKRLFKAYVCDERVKEAALFDKHEPLTRDEVLLGALRCICGGNMGAARELLGD